MKYNVHFINKTLKIVRNFFTQNPDQLFLLYKKCLDSVQAHHLKVCSKLSAISREHIINIFNDRFSVIFKNSRKDCVPYSLSLHILLYCFGYDSVLYIGINRFPFSAHAWVEDLDGNVLNCSDHLCKNRNIVFEKRLVING